MGPTGIGFAVAPDLPVEGASEELYLVVRVVNVGRRPMQWEGWGGRYFEPVNGRTSFNIVGEHLPRMLNERESHTEKMLLAENWLTNVKRFYVWDAAGEHWTFSGLPMHKLRIEAEKALETNARQN
jgi:hypothetical protein